MVTIPNGWTPRHYQRAVWDYFEKGGTRAAVAWHRRAGKDDVALHLEACSMIDRVGTYWHMLPQYAQGRKAIWSAVNPHTGKRRIDEAFPVEIRKRTNEQEMFIELVNGSTWQVVGSDSYDRAVGAPPVGVVFSEWALANPSAWAYIRPILAENGGWAFFISTYRGRNHHWKFVQRAIEDEGWFGEVLSVRDTGVLTDEQIATEQREYIQEYGADEGGALFAQEWMSDPMAAVQGAYFGPQMAAAEKERRITSVPPERGVPCSTWWDLGRDDETAIWIIQSVGREVRVIDYYASRNEKIDHYAKTLREKAQERQLEWGEHVLPHDGATRTIIGDSCQDQLEQAGFTNVVTVPRAQDGDAVIAGINEGRKMIERAVFDKERCEAGLEGLRNYRREWDDSLKTYKRTPLHDWASHPADAWRTGSVHWSPPVAETQKRRRAPVRRSGWLGR